MAMQAPDFFTFGLLLAAVLLAPRAHATYILEGNGTTPTQSFAGTTADGMTAKQRYDVARLVQNTPDYDGVTGNTRTISKTIDSLTSQTVTRIGKAASIRTALGLTPTGLVVGLGVSYLADKLADTVVHSGTNRTETEPPAGYPWPAGAAQPTPPATHPHDEFTGLGANSSETITQSNACDILNAAGGVRGICAHDAARNICLDADSSYVAGSNTPTGWQKYNVCSTLKPIQNYPPAVYMKLKDRCRGGYSDNGTLCTLTSATTHMADYSARDRFRNGRCDIVEAAGAYQPATYDPDCDTGQPTKITGTGTNTVTVTTPSGTAIKVTTNANGSKDFTIIDPDRSAGTTTTTTVKTGSDGTVTGKTQTSTQGTGDLGSTTPAQTVVTGGGGAPAPAIEFPDDYNREVTQQSIKTTLQDIKTGQCGAPGQPPCALDLGTDPETAEPDTSTPKTADDIKSALTAPLGAVTALADTEMTGAGTCPTGSFNALGETFILDAHCQIAADAFGTIATTLQAIWILFGVTLVLRA